MYKTALWVFAICIPFLAAADQPVPSLTGHVIDQTQTLSQDQIQALEQTLRTFEANKGSQLAVLIVASTKPESIEQYSIRVAEQWKLGRTKVDDGAILLIAKDDRTLRIEVGYGLEGALNDAVSKRIISEIIVPRFREGDFYGGIAAGVDRMIGTINGEPLPGPDENRGAAEDNLRRISPLILIVALVGGVMLRSFLGRFPGSVTTAALVGLMTWWLAGTLVVAVGVALLTFLLTFLGVWSLFGLGGKQEGGFRGGGGGFGGGGASGRW
ncbi:TPM domain-containing protein [Nevskia soli]|uniref:TPM domain-containing protein n=1 Tax=Nevskia soli TaxID=418856 RepID=UPI00068AC7D9|nr:YgcG family protein [Nevskia soli]